MPHRPHCPERQRQRRWPRWPLAAALACGVAPAAAEFVPIDVGGILFQPSLTLGSVYNSNLTPGIGKKKQSGLGASVAGGLAGNWASGLHSISANLAGSGQFYPTNSNGNSWSVSGAIGHRYEIMSDLVWNAQASANWFTNTLVTQPNLAQAGQYASYTQQSVQASLRRDFDLYFVEPRLGVTAQRTLGGTADAAGDANGTSYSAALRAGYKISPIISAFVEPSGNWQRFSSGGNDQQGYRIIAGLSSDRISLFSGELYAGVASQSYSGVNANEDPQPTYGGAINWFPTADLTFRAALSQAYGLAGTNQSAAYSPVTGITTGGDPLNPPTNTPVTPGNPNTVPVPPSFFTYYGGLGKTTTASLSANYVANSSLTTFASITYQHQTYVGGGAAGDVWSAATGFGYTLTSNWGLALGYTFSAVENGGGGQSYTQSTVTGGLVGRF